MDWFQTAQWALYKSVPKMLLSFCVFVCKGICVYTHTPSMVSYQQCSQEVVVPSCSAASSVQRGQSPDSDIVAGPLLGDSGLHVSVGLLLWGGGWGSSPGQLLSAPSCLDCSHQRCLPGEVPACGSANKPAL